jgi:hypothetical protein
MRIDNNKPVSPGAGIELYRSQSVQPQKDVEKAEGQQPQNNTDRIEISAEAQQLLASQRLAENDANGATQRNDAVASLSRNLVEAGVVEDSDRAQKIAEKVMTKVEETEQADQNRLEEIREKLKNNFYSSEQVTERIAERLQEELNIR